MKPLKHLLCLNVKHQQIGSPVQTYITFPKESRGFEGGPQNDSKTFPNQMSSTKCKITNTAQWAFTGNDERTQHTQRGVQHHVGAAMSLATSCTLGAMNTLSGKSMIA